MRSPGSSHRRDAGTTHWRAGVRLGGTRLAGESELHLDLGLRPVPLGAQRQQTIIESGLRDEFATARSSYAQLMPFDEGLAQRVRDLTQAELSLSERKMFGGLCFMSSGHMCFGVLGDEIMVRVGPDAYEEALQLPNAREMDFTGQSMRGMVYVGSEGIAEDGQLEVWLRKGLSYTCSLPPKLP